jgi:nicotinamide-nucleotide amidase
MDADLSLRPIRAVIIAVGSEMLTPLRTDTNSLTITDVLNAIGIDVASKLVVGDDREELDAQIGHALSRHPVLILTGGLGPTDDDLTREVVAAHLGLPLDEDPAIVESIRARFALRGWAMPEVNRKQALVPRGATVLVNARGSAPGLLIEHGDRIIAMLPGPPREVWPMISGPVRDRLLRLAGGLRLQRRVLRIAGRTESRAEELTQPIYSTWLAQVPRIETTILATPGLVELHLSTRVTDESAGVARLDRAVDQLRIVLGPDLVSANGETMEQVLGSMLRERGWRIALAESCTGGLATSRLTDVRGSSDYVALGVVAYSNIAKTEWVDVPESMIREHGAVSEQVARALAENVAALARTEVGVGITGIAGPGGGSEEKPVGTVWIAVATPDGTEAAVCRFLGGRELVKTWSAVTAADFVRRLLVGAPWTVDWALKTL